MAKPRTDYKDTLQYRFFNWLKTGREPLDDQMIDALGEPGLTEEAEHAQQNERHDRLSRARQERQAATGSGVSAADSVRHWSRWRGARMLDKVYALVSVVVCVTIIAILLSVVADMPSLGDSDVPSMNEVSRRYVEKGVEETGAVNFVAGMILDYRAFDTLGESTVLFIAACAVLILLRIDRDKDGHPSIELIAAESDDRHFEPKNDVILQGTARILTPVILLFGIYVVLNGHLSPGGGFSGGAIISAGLVLYLNAFGFKKAAKLFTYRSFLAISFSALMFYGLSKAYSFTMGANHLPSGIPQGTPGNILSSGLILPLNIAVGFVVACTMYVFYCLFRKGSLD